MFSGRHIRIVDERRFTVNPMMHWHDARRPRQGEHLSCVRDVFRRGGPWELWLPPPLLVDSIVFSTVTVYCSRPNGYSSH